MDQQIDAERVIKRLGLRIAELEVEVAKLDTLAQSLTAENELQAAELEKLRPAAKAGKPAGTAA